MLKQTDVAIIGAGPYGLSLAAHLRKKKADFCIFGKPMNTWRTQMPAGMSLKSEGFACNLSDPDGLLTLKNFCLANKIPYADIGVPVRLDTFSAYGVAFQRRFVPDLNENLVLEVTREGHQFRLVLEDGDVVLAKRVVVAAGIAQFAYIPPALSHLPSEFISHSSRHHSWSHFAGRDVAVIGAGASAVDVAVSLHEAGARPQLVTRRAEIPFHGKAPDKRSLLTRVKNPWSGLGPGWRSRLACDLPLLFHALPVDFRLNVVKKHLGPAPGWFTREIIHQHVAMHVGLTILGAEVRDGKVHLQCQSDAGPEEILVDHVIAGTGYRVDVSRLSFLDSELRDGIATEETSPKLSTSFESSVPGLYFTGTCAAASFGPLLRFAFGARFASQRISRHLVSSLRGDRGRSRKSSEEVTQASRQTAPRA